MPIHISAPELLMGVGDFLTIYLFGYMQRTFCEKKVLLDENGYPFSNEKNHGIGTRSVLAFINKTNSEIQYLSEEKRFRVRMII